MSKQITPQEALKMIQDTQQDLSKNYDNFAKSTAKRTREEIEKNYKNNDQELIDNLLESIEQ